MAYVSLREMMSTVKSQVKLLWVSSMKIKIRSHFQFITPIPGQQHSAGSEAQDWAATSHLYHRSKAITSVRTYRTSWSITRSFPCPSGSHQPSSNRLAPPERPTTSNLAPYHRVWPATDQPWPQLGVASRTRSFQNPNGVQLWIRLCSPLGVPPYDDDDEHSAMISDYKIYGQSNFSTVWHRKGEHFRRV